MANRFQFKIIVGATENECYTKYNNLKDNVTNLHDPYTFYLFDKGGVGFLGDTPLFGGDASKFNLLSSNTTTSTLKENSIYFITANCTLTDDSGNESVTHEAKTGSIWVTNGNKSISEISLSVFTTYIGNYIADTAIHSTDVDSNYSTDDTSIMTSGAVQALINRSITSSGVLDIAFFSHVSSLITVTSVNINLGKITGTFPNTGNPGVSFEVDISSDNTIHEGDQGIVFRLQSGTEYDTTEDANDKDVFVNLHGLINIYDGGTSDTATVTVQDKANAPHTKEILVNVNKSAETATSFESKILAAIETVNNHIEDSNNPDYNPTDVNGDNLSANKFITESQLADILAHVLSNFVEYTISGGGEGMIDDDEDL